MRSGVRSQPWFCTSYLLGILGEVASLSVHFQGDDPRGCAQGRSSPNLQRSPGRRTWGGGRFPLFTLESERKVCLVNAGNRKGSAIWLVLLALHGVGGRSHAFLGGH